MFALWHGGHSYAPPNVEQDTEDYDSLQDAREAFEARIANTDGRTPCVDGSRMEIFYGDPRETRDPHPDLVIEQEDDGNDYVTYEA